MSHSDDGGLDPTSIRDPLLGSRPPDTRLAAMTVAAGNETILVIEASHLSFGTTGVVVAPTNVIIAFNEDLSFRWAGALQGPHKLSVSSVGGFCVPGAQSFAVRVGLADGGLP